MLDLEPIKAREKEATKGPWIWYGTTFSERDLIVCEENHEMIILEPWTHDGAFIVHARTDIPDLIAEVERLRAKFRFMTNTLKSAFTVWQMELGLNEEQAILMAEKLLDKVKEELKDALPTP